MTKGPDIFPQWPNLSAKLAGNFCQELATLAEALLNSAEGKELLRSTHAVTLTTRQTLPPPQSTQSCNRCFLAYIQ